MPAACTGAGLLDYLTIMGGVAYPLPATGGTPTQPIGTSTTDRFCDMTFPPAVTSAYVRCEKNHTNLPFTTQDQFGCIKLIFNLLHSECETLHPPLQDGLE